MFRFRLEPVLQVRKRTEEKLQRELAQRRLEWEAASSQLAGMEGNRRRYRRELQEKRMRGMTVAELELYDAYFLRLDDDIARQESSVRDLAAAMETKRFELVEAAKKKKILERLKAKQHEAYAYEEVRRENRFLDEIAGQYRFRGGSDERRNL
jgi:flagellar protein FliJ